MRSPRMDGDPRLLVWLRVREFAVPRSMIETATARRAVGDWAGACAAARFDADVDLRAVARTHGRELAARVRADLRHLAPDLLRWHMPRIAPDGLVRPGLTVALAWYGPPGSGAPQLVARTPPAWADAGQRISLALWDGSRAGRGVHPHPHPDRRFRLDLHRHLWDARRTGELRERAGVQSWPGPAPNRARLAPEGCADHRWPAEAALLRQAEGRADDPLGGTPLPCLRMIDEANRNPQELADIRARLHHGDTAGAFAAVENLLGPEAVLRSGVLRDELVSAGDRRVAYGLYRAGLARRGPVKLPGVRRRPGRKHTSR